MDKIQNPHDKLIKEIWSDKKEARSFLENHLPDNVLRLINLDSLEIAKDSFIEEDLSEQYSDLLYHVKFKEDPGFVYLLFEHKSYQDKRIHLQLFGYMIKIWKLHAKQHKKQKLPVIVPLVIYHGQTKWEIGTRFSSIISEPYEHLAAYVPDFDFILYDLTQYADDELKANVLSQIMLLLFKHIHDNDLLNKLPGILSLINRLMTEETGEKSIETLLIYLISVVELTIDEVTDIVVKSVSEDKGDLLMTLAERLRNEGFQAGKLEGIQQGKQEGIRQGKQEGIQEGIREGLIEGIELAIALKFNTGPEQQKMIQLIRNIQDINMLKKAKTAIMDVRTIPELIDRLKQ